MALVHVIGAGVSGLACAVRSADRNANVRLYEAAPQAGGRCRSLFDAELERWIDNGNHLVLAANTETFSYLDAIGARDSLVGPDQAIFPFLDLKNGKRWAVRPNDGLIPWWIFVADRRVPETGPLDYLGLLKLAFAKPLASVASCFGHDRIYARLLEPLAVAVLNAPASEGAAALLWAVVARTFLKGGLACRPFVARENLSASFIEPALNKLRAKGCDIAFQRRLKSLVIAHDRVIALEFADGATPIPAEDAVVLAVPSWTVPEIAPWVLAPRGFRAIVNAHFRLTQPRDLGNPPFLGLIGGLAQWLFVRGDVASVTISGADHVLDWPAEKLAAEIWRDVATALRLPHATPPPCRVIKERRATFAQTPENLSSRARTETPIANLFLAGDWTDTGLPATIESAIVSGHMAAARAARYNESHRTTGDRGKT
jgi:squalene-associated FAD-dependent desaturase